MAVDTTNRIIHGQNLKVGTGRGRLNGRWRFEGMLAWTLLLAAVVLFVLRAKAGLTLFSFGDESEKFVIAKMLNEGSVLYKDIFSHHGPVSYMLAHLYTKIVSTSDFTWIRLSQVILAAGACLAIAFSPVIKRPLDRMWATALFLSVLSAFWVLNSIHMLLYQSIGGFLLLIVLAQMVLPALLEDKLHPAGLFVSGFALVMACFAAYSFGPATVLLTASATLGLIASGARFQASAKPFLAGLLTATTAVVLWLFFFGDLLGFLVYHFYFNQEVYANFTGYSLWAVTKNISVSFAGPYLVHTIAVIYFAIWVFALSVITIGRPGSRYRFWWKLCAMILLVVAIPFSNPRGGIGFHGAAFVIINIGALALIGACACQRWTKAPVVMVLLFIVAEIAAHNALSSPHGIARAHFAGHVAQHKPTSSGVAGFIRSLTGEDDRILSLIFHPVLYVQADRLPSSGHFYYLPWQAAYNRVSVNGYKMDICRHIETHRPKVIWFDNWHVWDRYWIEEYEHCVPEVIRDNYRQMDNHLYLRSDVAQQMVLEEPAAGYRLRPSPALRAGSSIRLSMIDNIVNTDAQPEQIGIRFGTHRRVNRGEAALHLETVNGDTHIIRFSLADLTDNRYRYFDLVPAQYVSGRIVSVTGGGVSSWESINEETEEAHTCMVYKLSGGQWRFTPGCPGF